MFDIIRLMLCSALLQFPDGKDDAVDGCYHNGVAFFQSVSVFADGLPAVTVNGYASRVNAILDCFGDVCRFADESVGISLGTLVTALVEMADEERLNEKE